MIIKYGEWFALICVSAEAMVVLKDRECDRYRFRHKQLQILKEEENLRCYERWSV